MKDDLASRLEKQSGMSLSEEVVGKTAQELYSDLESNINLYSISIGASGETELLGVFYCVSLLVLKLKNLDAAEAEKGQDSNDHVHHDYYHKVLQKKELYQFLGLKQVIIYHLEHI